MPKISDYPKASFKSAIELADAVEKLGGNCNRETCASQLGKKVSGAFVDRIATTKKFGLIIVKKGTLTTTQLYKDYKLAYDDQEKTMQLKKAFLKVPLFQEMYNKYKNSELPVNILDKVLVKEFNVDERYASRVGKFFIEGAKTVKILNQDNTFMKDGGETSEETSSPSTKQNKSILEGSPVIPKDDIPRKEGVFFVQIKGPGISQTIELIEEDHLMLVEAALRIIKKKLSKRSEEDEKNPEPSN